MSGFLELIEEVRKIFALSNQYISEKISLHPNIHEPFLDNEFVTARHLMPYAPPAIVLPSGWKCRIDLRFTGGVYFGGEREVADLAILVHFRKNNQPVRTKIALCQSKRLYPKRTAARRSAHRVNFKFTDDCHYKALKVRDEQWKTILHWEKERSIKVYYVLYNPCELPSSVDVPLDLQKLPSLNCVVGARVLPAIDLRKALTSQSDDYVPTYKDLYNKAPNLLSYKENWRLEDFVSELLIGCKVGNLAKDMAEAAEFYLRFGRTWPITSAIEITVDMPENEDLPSFD